MTSHDQFLIEIGRVIRELRTNNAWTQAQLAEEAATLGAPTIHRQEISQMESGKFTGSVRKLQAVLRALRYTLSAQVARTPQLDELDELFGHDA